MRRERRPGPQRLYRSVRRPARGGRPGTRVRYNRALGRRARERHRRTAANPPAHELLPASRLLLLQPARRRRGVLREPRRRRAARLREGPHQGARPERQGQESGSTRPAASTAARRARCSSSIPKASGTPTSTAPTSTRSSTVTSSGARSSRGCAFDAEDDRAARRSTAPPARSRSSSTRPRSRRRAASRSSRIRIRCRAARSTTRSCRRSRRRSSRWATSATRFNFRGVGRSRRDASTTASARPTTRSRRSRYAQQRFGGQSAAGRARRILVRHVRADARRRRRSPRSGSCWSGRRCSASARRTVAAGHDRHPRRGGRRRAARRRARVGAAAGSCRSSCFPAAAISSTAACRSCSGDRRHVARSRARLPAHDA